MRVGDTKALESCTAELGKAAQNDPKTISYEWALAVQKRDQSGALGLIDRARQAGVSAEGLAIMEKTTLAMGSSLDTGDRADFRDNSFM